MQTIQSETTADGRPCLRIPEELVRRVMQRVAEAIGIVPPNPWPYRDWLVSGRIDETYQGIIGGTHENAEEVLFRDCMRNPRPFRVRFARMIRESVAL